MALVLELQSITGLSGSSTEKFCKFEFRKFKKYSKPAKGTKAVTFYEVIKWALARKIDDHDAIQIKVFNKGIKNSFYGGAMIWLHEFAGNWHGERERKKSYNEALIDKNNKQLTSGIQFILTYMAPDSRNSAWNLDEFRNPVIDTRLAGPDETDDGLGRPRRRVRSIKPAESMLAEGDKSKLLLDDSDSDQAEDVKLLEDFYSRRVVRKGQGGVTLDTGDVISDLDPAELQKFNEAIEMQEVRNMTHVGRTIQSTDDFQLVITLVEGKEFAGSNINPYITVTCGDEKRETNVQPGTNQPYYNQVFIIDFAMQASKILDQVLVLQAFSKSDNFFFKYFAGTPVGEFRLDIRSIYNQPNRMYHNKWAVFVDPKNPSAGPRGYLRCHMYLVLKGETVRIPEQKVADDEQDLFKHLLLPVEKSGTFQMAELSVKIFKAEDLPKMSTDLVATIKNVILGDSATIDPFLDVTYAGYTESTDVKTATYRPVWNTDITFVEKFPSLCTRIVLTVRDKTSPLTSNVVATHYVELAQIMDSNTEDGYMPTFGPSWINLYGKPRNYSFDNWVNYDEELNQGLGEGVAYRGRVLVAIKSKITDSNSKVGVARRKMPALDMGVEKVDWTLLGFPFEVSALGEEYARTPLSLELSIGPYGNMVDGRIRTEEEELAETRKMNMTIKNAEKDFESKYVGALVEVLSESTYHSTSEPSTPVSADDNQGLYYCLPIKKEIECLFVRFKWEDLRMRMFIPNMLDKVIHFLEAGLGPVKKDLEDDNEVEAIRKIQGICKYFLSTLSRGLRELSSIQIHTKRTQLEAYRKHHFKVTLEKLKLKALKIKKMVSKVNVFDKLRELRTFLVLLKQLAEAPEHALPDVFIWLLSGEKRIAYARVPARQILFSEYESFAGKNQNSTMTIFLKKPGKSNVGKSGWHIQAQVKIFLWLGLNSELNEFKSGLPDGYDFSRDRFGLPKSIVYRNEVKFQFRGYVYLAKNLIGSDDSGLSDPFVRILIRDKVVTSKKAYQTLNPIWDQTLIIEEIDFFQSVDMLKEKPPPIVLEIFDYDDMSEAEYIGRTVCRPTIVLHDDGEYDFPKLIWWEVFRNQKPGGQILAAFELIELRRDEEDFFVKLPKFYPSKLARMTEKFAAKPEEEEDETDDAGIAKVTSRLKAGPFIGEEPGEDPEKAIDEADANAKRHSKHKSKVIHAQKQDFLIPREIAPKLEKFRLEVLFWGVREMKKVKFMSVDKPEIQVDWAGNSLISDVLADASVHPNFSGDVGPHKYCIKHMDLELPENTSWWPPILVRCMSHVAFIDPLFVGSKIISPSFYYIDQEALERHNKKLEMLREAMKPLAEEGWKPVEDDAADFTGVSSKIGEYGNELSKRRLKLDEKKKKLKAAIKEQHRMEKLNEEIPEPDMAQFLPVGTSLATAAALGLGAEEASEFTSSSVATGEGKDEVDSAKKYEDKTDGKGTGENGDDRAGEGAAGEHTDGADGAAPGTGGGTGGGTANAGAAGGAAKGTTAPKGAPPNLRAAVPGKLLAMNQFTKPRLSKKELEEVDWWAKFYATIDTIVEERERAEEEALKVKKEEKKKREMEEIAAGDKKLPIYEPGSPEYIAEAKKLLEAQLAKDKELDKRKDVPYFYDGGPEATLAEDSDSLVDADELLEGIDVDIKSEAEDDVMDVPDLASPFRRRRKKKKKGGIFGFLRKKKKFGVDKRLKKIYQRELKADGEIDDAEPGKGKPGESVRDLITKMVIYPCKLESVPEFNLFEWVHSYPLFIGKENEESEDPGEEDVDRVVGIFKGNVMIYKIKEEEFRQELDVKDRHRYKLSLYLPPPKPVTVIVRVYIVRALDLHPEDNSGLSDPYLVLRLGNETPFIDRDNYIAANLNPVFGRTFEWETVFPKNSILHIAVFDWDRFSITGDDLIGETKIDLENRLYNRHYARCGISQSYDIFGYNKWRDNISPSKILEKLYRMLGIKKKPKYEAYNQRVLVAGQEFYGPVTYVEESGKSKPSNEPLALEALKHFENIPEIGAKIVPEHVETRGLFNSEHAGVEQGRLQMWVDIFEKDLGQPPPVTDITPRKPESYQLRMIVWNTGRTKRMSYNFLTGEKSSDVFVRSWFNGRDIDSQETDVHYFCDGDGMFNWRFIFNIDYLKAEDKIIVRQDDTLFSSDKDKIKRPPVLMIQCWDSELIGSNNFIGSLELKLSKFAKGARSSKTSGLHQVMGDRDDIPMINLFTLTSHRAKGWWPFRDKDKETNQDEFTGAVELEFHILPLDEAEASPAGKGRDEPEALEKPNRPTIDLLSLLNPLNLLKHFFWRYKWVLLKIFLIMLLIAFIALFIYTLPTALSSTLVGFIG